MPEKSPSTRHGEGARDVKLVAEIRLERFQAQLSSTQMGNPVLMKWLKSEVCNRLKPLDIDLICNGSTGKIVFCLKFHNNPRQSMRTLFSLFT